MVNVITKTGAAIDGTTVTYESGSNGTQLARGMIGHRLSNGVDYAFSSTVERTDGVPELYFPVFDTPDQEQRRRSWSRRSAVSQHYGRLSFGDLTFTGAYGATQRCADGVLGTLFNEQIERERTIDRHTMVDADYTRPFGRTRVTLRGAYDRFTYERRVPYPGFEPGQRVALGLNDVVGSWWTASGRDHAAAPTGRC